MPAYNDAYTITILMLDNPKGFKPDGSPSRSRLRYALYKNGMTVAQYKAAVAADPKLGSKGYAAADIIWDTEHKFISVAAPANVATETPAPEAAQPEAAVKAEKPKRTKKAK